jgi:hypothetical protein
MKPPVKKVASNGKAQATGISIPKPTTTGKGSARTLYSYDGKYPENVDKATPQMLALIDTVKEATKTDLDKSGFTAQACVALAVKEGFLSTRQDPLRIFRFYVKRLIDEGYFSKV